MKTLIVEDDMMSQCLLAKVLTERGHEVVSFDNAEQAILAYQKEFYPLLFVDVDLPGMDGLQFCKWVRAQPRGEQVFIIVATSDGRPADLGDVLLVGANDFLPKPYDSSALGVRLSVAEGEMKHFFERHDLEQSLRESGEGLQRLESELAETRQGADAQIRDLPAELEKTRESATAEGQKLESARADLESRLRQESAERAKLADQVNAEAAGRRKMEGQLARARDELSARVKELTAESSKAREALHHEAKRRKETEETLGRVQRESESALQARQDELAASARELKAEQTARG